MKRLAHNIVGTNRANGAAALDRDALVYLSGLRVADMAVGVGRFPVAWLTLFDSEAAELDEDQRAHLKRESFRKMEFTDVDRPALELAVIAAAANIGPLGLDELHSPRLRHGNALLEKVGGPDASVMLSSGHIWHPESGVVDAASPVDVVIGNPPWERVRYEGKQFMRGFDTEAADSEPLVLFAKERRIATESGIAAMRNDARLTRSTHGEIYTHVAFTELAMRHTEVRSGWVCQIVKSTMLNSPGHARLIGDLLRDKQVAEVWDFNNSERVFPIDSRERFAVLIAGHRWKNDPNVVFGLSEVSSLEQASRLTPLRSNVRDKLSPKLGILPACSGSDLDLLLTLSELPTFHEVHPSVIFGRLLHLTNHSSSIHRQAGIERVPVWEGRMIEQFTSKFSTWEGVPPEKRWLPKTKANQVDVVDRMDLLFQPTSRWWVDQDKWFEVSKRFTEQYSIGWRNASAPTNRRTVLASILRQTPTIQSVQVLQTPSASELMLILGVMNSLPFDWLVRRRMAGIDVTSTLIGGTPVPEPSQWDQLVTFGGIEKVARDHLIDLVADLVREDARNNDLLRSVNRCQGSVPEFRSRWGIQRRIDVLVAWAYGLDLKTLQFLALDFPKEISQPEYFVSEKDKHGDLDNFL
jgi:hypothetical protein